MHGSYAYYFIWTNGVANRVTKLLHLEHQCLGEPPPLPQYEKSSTGNDNQMRGAGVGALVWPTHSRLPSLLDNSITAVHIRHRRSHPMVVVGAQQRKCQSLEEHYQRKATKYWNDFYKRHNKKGPELLNKYVGESELAVRTLFSCARTCSPCILFFDEVDALTTKRGKEGGWVVERLLNQLLIELDGADQWRGVFVIGATNRPDVMDRAVLRPGRFGKLLYVPLPTANERRSCQKKSL
ncbi:hypothetical protein LWI29_035671 [Acer saccharum]|uniref:ATPase AAA-type core domain-containing protein n=1 Tax=Acer saccharum TaxID=4024 RepID=A0AA39SV60_ACESA|nr:hypothetical protein LWI29_035671 [Acer saccharum]